MRRFILVPGAMVACAVLISTGWVTAATASQPADPIAQQLDSKDSTQIAQAVAIIQQQLQSTDTQAVRVAVQGLTRGNHWLKKLMDAGQYDQVVSLTTQATLALPSDIIQVEYLQWYRVQALLKLNQPQQALAVAKGLFNVSRQQNTANALQIIVDCLKAANSGNAATIDQLRMEQTAGASTDQHSTSNAQLSALNGAGLLAAVDYQSSVLSRTEGVTSPQSTIEISRAE